MQDTHPAPIVRRTVAGALLFCCACAAGPERTEAAPVPPASEPAVSRQIHVDFSRLPSAPAVRETPRAPVRPSRFVATARTHQGSALRDWAVRDPASRRLALDAEDASLRAQLGATRMQSITVRDEESLRSVIDLVRDATGLPLVVTPGAEQAVLDAGVVFDFELNSSISVKNLLNLIGRATDGAVVWRIRHEAVILASADSAPDPTQLVMHDIQALTMVRTDFLAPRIDRLRLLDEIEDDDGGGPFGGIGEQARQMEGEDVAALVQENIEPGSWDRDGVSIEAANGFLFVRHTLEVQRRIAVFLESLGGA